MTVTPTPAIDDMPEAPQRLTDTRAQFSTKADPFVAAMNTHGQQTTAVGQAAELNAEAAEAAATSAEAASEAAVGSTSYAATTTVTLSLALGSTGSFTIQTGKGFVATDRVGLVSRANDAVRMAADVTSYNSGTGAMVCNVTAFQGSGSASGWAVILKALEGLSPEQSSALAISFAVAL